MRIQKAIRKSKEWLRTNKAFAGVGTAVVAAGLGALLARKPGGGSEQRTEAPNSPNIIGTGNIVNYGGVSPQPPAAVIAPFRLGIRSVAISDAPGRLALFMVGYRSMYGHTASPVFCLANVEIVNPRDFQITVDRYALAISDNSDGPWVDLVPISLRTADLYVLGVTTTDTKNVAFPSGTYRFAKAMKPSEMAHAALLKPNPTLERELLRPIEPHQTVAGWAAFDLPRNINRVTPNFLRITVRDTTGAGFSTITEVPRGKAGDAEQDAQPGLIEKVGPVVDIQRFHVRYYSERYPHRLKPKL